MVGEAIGVADQLDLEAAEQLIQLSGGDGTSESRSADSVKCCGADKAATKEKHKDRDEMAVESRRRRRSRRRSASGKKDGDAEVDWTSAESVNRRSRVPASEEEPAVESRRRSVALAARFLAVKDGAGAGVGDDGGEERKRPRFRWLADIYRDTRQLTTRDQHRAAGRNVPPEADERRKRAADEVVVPVVPKVSSKARTMVA